MHLEAYCLRFREPNTHPALRRQFQLEIWAELHCTLAELNKSLLTPTGWGGETVEHFGRKSWKIQGGSIPSYSRTSMKHDCCHYWPVCGVLWKTTKYVTMNLLGFYSQQPSVKAAPEPEANQFSMHGQMIVRADLHPQRAPSSLLMILSHPAWGTSLFSSPGAFLAVHSLCIHWGTATLN